MNFIVSFKKILQGLQKVQSIIERKETKPILSNILIKTKNSDNIEINATNLEVSIKELCEAKVLKEGSVVLDAKKIYEIIKEMPNEEICFRQKENFWVEVSVKNIFFNIVGLDPEGFPETSFLEKEKFQEINKKNLKELVERTIYAASSDETKINLNGVFFQRTTQGSNVVLRAVATDGHRLSIMDKNIEELNKEGDFKIEQFDEGVLFPKKGLLELKKMIDEENKEENIYFLYSQNSGFFRRGNTALVIRAINEEFPNYSQAIPREIKIESVINRLELLKALRRISVIAEEVSKAIRLEFSEKSLGIYTQNPIMGEGKETISIEYKGEPIKLGFNAGYLIDALNAIISERVTLKIKDSDSGVVITPFNNKKYTCIIMPMDIND